MSKDIKIRKGFDIKLQGEAERVTKNIPEAKVYALQPNDFHGVIPKLLVKEGMQVKAGTALFFAKGNESIKFSSPVSGRVEAIERGEKRKILAIKIASDSEQQYEDFGIQNLAELDRWQTIEHLTQTGCWPFVKQRPYDIVASPHDVPKAIFVSGINSSPLAPDYEYTLKDKKVYLQAGFDVLQKLTTGKVHVTVKKNSEIFPQIKGVEFHYGKGKHPVGLISTQIAKIDPLSKGEKIWVVQPDDVAIIGELFLTGKFNASRLVALTGTGVQNPLYVKTKIGASITTLLAENENSAGYRIISGNVLTGTTSSLSGFLGYYDTQLTLIPEGDDYDLFGWARPRPNKLSFSRASMFSFLTPNKRYNLSTNLNGEHRAFVVTGEYEKVFPLDIYPMQLLKAILIKDIDQMEALGIYEVAPEDFALTEFICVSKQDHQYIVREGLDLMIKEVG